MSYYSEDAKQASDTHAFTDSIDTVLRNLGLVGTPDGTLFGFTSDVLAANGIPLTMRGLPWREAMNNEGNVQGDGRVRRRDLARDRPAQRHVRPALHARREGVQLAERSA